MFKQNDNWGRQAGLCKFDRHYIRQSHICVYKECNFQRIGCIKCQKVLHYHKLGGQSLYLQFEDFKQYIKVIIDNQLLKYQYNEELIILLKKENKNSPLIQKTIQSLQKTQLMFLNNFKLAEIRWNAFTDIDNQIIQDIIEMDGNEVFKQDQINQILLSQLRQIGVQIPNQEIKKQEQNQMLLMKSESNIKKKDFCNQCSESDFKISPNEEYMAQTCLHKLEIFKIKSSQQIVKRKLRKSWIAFSDDSKFYFYCDSDQSIHFMAIQSCKKSIFQHAFTKKEIIFKVFLLNTNEIVVSSQKEFFIILRVNNRNIRQFIHKTNNYRQFVYDDLNKVIICGTQSTISFLNYYTSSLIFEKQIQCNKVELIKSTNHLIIAYTVQLNLYMINYQKKELYLLNKFASGGFQLLDSIFHIRYPIIIIESGLIILDEGLNKIQYFRFKKRIPLMSVDLNPFVFCNQYFNYKLILNLDKLQLFQNQ